MNLLDRESINTKLRETNPDLVIHCAAERRPDISEGNHDATQVLNAQATASLARQAKRCESQFIYISTDYVFDGTAPPYTVDAAPHPLNFYGESKLAGEKQVAEILPKAHYILRLPILYGQVAQLDECPAMALAMALKSAEKISLDDWAIRFPTLTDDVAFVLRQMTEKIFGSKLAPGAYHWQSDEPFTKYGMARAMGEVMGLPTDHLVPVPTSVSGAPRPKNCQMDCSRLQHLGIGRRSDFRFVIKELLKRFF